MTKEPANGLTMKPLLSLKIAIRGPIPTAECTTTVRAASISNQIPQKSKISLVADHYFAEVKWCAEISAAVVLYDYGIGVEFDPKMNPTTGNGKLIVIKGGVNRNKP
jgi:hypothetical protein